MAAARSDKSKPYLPLASGARDGFSNAKEASATCFCGKIQMAFLVNSVLTSFICHCSDCRKIARRALCLYSCMFITISNFTVKDEHARFIRGQNVLRQFGPQKETIARGHEMANYFCGECGSLMYRVGSAFPGCKIMRLGTVDDFNLVERPELRPKVEQFIENRVDWLKGAADDIPRAEGMSFFERAKKAKS